MKKIFLIICLMLIVFVPTALAVDENLQASLSRYEPLPAQPGQYVTVYIQLENNANDDAPNAYLEIVESFPFTIINEENSKAEIGILKSQQSYVADFKLRVDSNAVVGINKLKIKYTLDKDSNQWREKELSIEVKPSEAKLAVNKVELIPEEIFPGESGTLTLTVKNSASIVFRDLAVKLDLSSDENIPLIPLNSVSEKQVGILKPGELTQINFPISVYPTATPGYYKVPVQISFYDDEGNQREQSDIIGIIISSSPELKIVYDSYEKTENFVDIRLKSINKGINDLKFLDIELLPSTSYECYSSKEYYVGDLDSDDYRTADFEIKTNEREFILKLKATFRDENNKLYTENMEVPVKLINGNESKGVSGWFVFLLLIVLVGLIYYIYRCKKNHKHK